MKKVALLLALLAGCGKKEPESPGDPPGYGAFKYRNFILGQTMSGGASLDGSVDIDGSRDAGGASDWIEVAVNGNTIGRTTGSRVSHPVRFRPGPNKVLFFSTAAIRYWEFDVDARLGTRVELTPKEPKEYDIVVRKDD